MNILKDLDNKVADMVRTRAAFGKHSTKKDLVTYVGLLESSHLSVVRSLETALTTLGPKLSKELSKNSKSYPQYFMYKKFLSNKASAVESKSALGTLVYANKKMANILSSMTKDIDKLFPTEKISMLNMRISHVVVAGVLRQSVELATYTKYMFSYVSTIKCGIGGNPKYRMATLSANADSVADSVSKILDNTGAVDYMATVDKIRASGSDVNLIDRDAKSQVASIASGIQLGPNNRGVVVSGIVGVPLFRELGETVNLLRKIASNYLTQEEDWMRSHVSILNASLNGVDESDPEFKKLKRIIDRYESMINMLAKLKSVVE